MWRSTRFQSIGNEKGPGVELHGVGLQGTSARVISFVSGYTILYQQVVLLRPGSSAPKSGGPVRVGHVFLEARCFGEALTLYLRT